MCHLIPVLLTGASRSSLDDCPAALLLNGQEQRRCFQASLYFSCGFFLSRFSLAFARCCHESYSGWWRSVSALLFGRCAEEVVWKWLADAGFVVEYVCPSRFISETSNRRTFLGGVRTSPRCSQKKVLVFPERRCRLDAPCPCASTNTSHESSVMRWSNDVWWKHVWPPFEG